MVRKFPEFSRFSLIFFKKVPFSRFSLSRTNPDYTKFWLSNLKDALMLHACERFELHTFGRFREIKTNSLLPRTTDQKLRHFQHQWGVRKVRK